MGMPDVSPFHNRRSYSLFNNDTQKPKVSSATTFDGVMLSCRPAICLFACEIYRFNLASPGVVGNVAYQSYALSWSPVPGTKHYAK